MQETWVWSLGWEDPLEKGTAAHSSILAWSHKESDMTEQLHFHFQGALLKKLKQEWYFLRLALTDLSGPSSL